MNLTELLMLSGGLLIVGGVIGYYVAHINFLQRTYAEVKAELLLAKSKL